MIGIDLIISDINTYLASKLWLTGTGVYYGRVFENEKEKGIVPEILSGSTYKEVLPDSKKDFQLFWRVKSDMSRVGVPLETSLFVYINLDKIFPTYGNDEARELAVYQLKELLNFTQFRFENTVIGKDFFSMWKDASQNKNDMNKNYMFRFDGDISVLTNSQVETVTPTSVELTVSAGTGGSVIASDGTVITTETIITAAYKNNYPFYAAASTGYRFLQWIRNAVASALNPINLYADTVYNLAAQFIKQWTLTSSVDGAGTITPVSGTYDEGTLTVTATPTDPLITELDRIEITKNGETTIAYTSPYELEFNIGTVLVAFFQ